MGHATFIRWQIPTELSPDEQRVAQKLRRIGELYESHGGVGHAAGQLRLARPGRRHVESVGPCPPGSRDVRGQNSARIRRGVAERMPSLRDPEMRHGRKTRTRPFTGDKRHVVGLVDLDLMVGAEVRPAK